MAAGVTTQVRLVSIPSTDPLAAPGNQSLRTRVSINGSVRSDAIVSQEVVRQFFELVTGTTADAVTLDRELRSSLLSVEHHVRVPESAGFGSSGAAALSLSLALNDLLGSPLSRTQCGALAHCAEINCGTGLGTVIGEFYGGCEIRTVAGAPGVGSIERFDVGERVTAIFVVYGPLSTKSMLADPAARERINAAGRRYLDRLLAEKTVGSFMTLSREFAEGSGLISARARATLDLFDAARLPASMLMFGDGVFALALRQELPVIRRLLDKSGQNADLLVSTIEPDGGRIIRED